MELTQEQSDMVELFDDLGMTMEAIDFAEECNGNKCGGGSKVKENEEVEESGVTKARNKVLSTAYDIGDGIDDIIEDSPVGPVRNKVSKAINPLGHDQGKSNKKEREQLRKKKKSIWANESLLDRIPYGSVKESVNFFKLTQNGLTPANEAAINDRIAMLDNILASEGQAIPTTESFDPSLEFGLDDIMLDLQ